MTDLEKHYLALSEVYLVAYQELQKPIYQINVAKGVVTEMMGELVKHEMSFGKTTKSESTEARLKILMSAIDSFENVSLQNFQYQQRLKANMSEIVDLKERIQEYESKIATMTEMLQQDL